MSVYLRGNTYYMDITLPDGRRVHRSTGKRTKPEALLEEAKVLGGWRTSDRPMLTLGQAIERAWSDRWCSQKSGEASMMQAKRMLEVVGDVPLDAITGDTISAMRTELMGRGVMPSTANRYCSILRTVLNMANREWELIDRVPMFRLASEKVYARTRTISRDEESRMMRILEDNPTVTWSPWLKLMIPTILDTGMRLGEATQITDREVSNDTLFITKEISKTSSERIIPLTPRAKGILSALGPGTLFPHNVDWYGKGMNWLRDKMGLGGDREFCIHALRHTFATRLIERGVGIYVVSKLLGHSNVATTERYAHMVSAPLEDAISKLVGGL